jgi:triosephosphate isomerase
MPKNYLIANWKMNVPPEGIDEYFAVINRRAAELAANATTVIAPPFPLLAEAASLAASVAIGAQNCSDRQKGAYTGEVSAELVAAAGAHFVIIGHSERRNLYGESDAFIAGKVAAALEAGLVPVLCIGESLAIRDADEVAAFLGRQIEAAAAAVMHGEAILVAYEPVWAIGTGRNASAQMVADTVLLIRQAMATYWPAGFDTTVPVLYGGSVTPENTEDLWDSGSVQGFLVGGACLDSGKLMKILAGMRAPS